MRRLSLFAFCLFFPLSAHALPVIADLSDDTITIDSSFAGKNILLFGARNEPGDVVVVMRGPTQDYILRKKERVLGIWINQDQVKFRAVPDFYKIISTRPLASVVPTALRHSLGLGLDAVGVTPNRPLPGTLAEDFTRAFLERQTKRSLFLADDKHGLSFMGESLFKIPFIFPDSIIGGVYTAEIYLFSDGQLTAMQTIPLSVIRSGFDAWVSSVSHNHPIFYGMVAVLLALGIGWVGNDLFKKV